MNENLIPQVIIDLVDKYLHSGLGSSEEINLSLRINDIMEYLDSAKKQKRISNAYDLICYLKKSNKFKAYVMDLKVYEERTFGLLVVYAEPDFKKMINVELPKNIESIKKYQEIDIEIYYNSRKHSFSSTNLRKRVKESIEVKKDV